MVLVVVGVSQTGLGHGMKCLAETAAVANRIRIGQLRDVVQIVECDLEGSNRPHNIETGSLRDEHSEGDSPLQHVALCDESAKGRLSQDTIWDLLQRVVATSSTQRERVGIRSTNSNVPLEQRPTPERSMCSHVQPPLNRPSSTAIATSFLKADAGRYLGSGKAGHRKNRDRDPRHECKGKKHLCVTDSEWCWKVSGCTQPTVGKRMSVEPENSPVEAAYGK